MNAILEALLGAAEGAGYVLDTPGALLRGALAGRPGTRASGRDMLESWGAVGANEDQGWIPDAGDIAGFAADTLVDPLNLLGAGWLKKVMGVGRAAKAHNAISMADRARGFMPEEIVQHLHPSVRADRFSPVAGKEGALADLIRKHEIYEDIPDSVAARIRNTPNEALLGEHMGNLKQFNNADEVLAAGGDAPLWFEEANKLGLLQTQPHPRRFHHGTQYEFGPREYDMTKMDPQGLKGPGIYTTDSGPVASGYSLTKPEPPVHRFYHEAPGSEEAWRKAMHVANNDPSLLYTPQSPGTIPRDILEDLGHAFKDDVDTHDTLMDYVHDIFKKAGYPEGASKFIRNDDLVLRPAHVKQHFIDIRKPFRAELEGGDKLTLDQLKQVLVDPEIEDIQRIAAEQGDTSGFTVMNKPKPHNWTQNSPNAARQWHGQISKDDNLIWRNRGTDDETVDSATFGELLNALGYDSIIHQGQGGVGFGGLGTGGYGEHQVAIALGNNQMYLPYIAAALKKEPSLAPVLASILGHNAATNTQRNLLRDPEGR